MDAQSGAHRTERLLSGYSGRMLLVLTLGWALVTAVRYVIPPLLPEIQADLSISLTQAGTALTVLYILFGVTQFPGGRLSDSWTRSTLIVPAFVVVAIACLALSVASNYAWFLASCAVLGVGVGLFSIPSRAFLSDLFVTHRGRALGVFGIGHDLGGGLAAGAGVVLLGILGWRATFLPLAGITVAILALFVVWSRESYGINRATLGIGEAARRLVVTAAQRRMLVAFTLFFFMITGFINFLPAYLRDVKGFSPAVATASFGILFVLGFVIKPLGGAASDRVSRELVATVGLVLSAIAVAILLVVDSLPGVLFAIVVFSVGYKPIFPVVDALFLDAAPEGSMGADLGAAHTLFLTLGSLGPTFVGAVAERFSFELAFGALGASLLLAAAVLTFQATR